MAFDFQKSKPSFFGLWEEELGESQDLVSPYEEALRPSAPVG